MRERLPGWVRLPDRLVRVRIDDDGITLPRACSDVLDLRLGEHRAWSFNPDQDGWAGRRGVHVRWPPALRERLTGRAQVTVVPHRDGAEPVFAGTVDFAGSSTPLELVDDLGHPLSVDKEGHLQRTFDRFDPTARAELVEATRKVLADLNGEVGATAFLVYGCLLGAVRDGHMIGHDSDSDVAVLSRHEHPFDIIREMRRVEAAMRERGWTVVRMSAANFKVWVPLSSGKRAGVDVFGSFRIGEHFYLTGNLRGELPREAIVPLGEIELEGVPLPAPRDPEAVLAYCYGDDWRVPDPSFRFLHPPEHVRTMSAWLRGARRRSKFWEAFYKPGGGARGVPAAPSAFARWVADRIGADDALYEVGAGTGRDALWFAGRGHDVRATDRVHQAVTAGNAAARRAGTPVRFRRLNLETVSQVLAAGGALAHAAAQPGPVRHVYARGIVDALEETARPNLWRLCSMAGRRGGRTFLEFRTAASSDEPTHFEPHERTYAEPHVIVGEIERAGGTVVEQTTGRGLAVLDAEDPEICRLVVDWTHSDPADPTSEETS